MLNSSLDYTIINLILYFRLQLIALYINNYSIKK